MSRGEEDCCEVFVWALCVVCRVENGVKYSLRG